MLMTTTNNVEGKRILHYYGIVSGETIIGANMFSLFRIIIHRKEMKKSLVLVAFMALPGLMMSQKKGFDYKFYGQVRTDLFYNSRANSETVDGLFYMYPKDISSDADGKDLNSFANGGFYTLYSRFCKIGSGFPRFGNFIFNVPYATCIFQSGLGQVCIACWSDMASSVWRCGSRHTEPEYGCTVPAFQPCSTIEI